MKEVNLNHIDLWGSGNFRSSQGPNLDEYKFINHLHQSTLRGSTVPASISHLKPLHSRKSRINKYQITVNDSD